MCISLNTSSLLTHSWCEKAVRRAKGSVTKVRGVHGEGTSGDEIKVGVRYAGGRGREGRGSWLDWPQMGEGNRGERG